MKNSLEFAVEDFFIRLFRATGLLKGKEIVHFEEERKAKANAIIVQGKIGEVNEAGPGGFDVEMTIEYRAPINTTKQTNNLVVSAMRDVIYNSQLAVTARRQMAIKAGLESLVIKNESSSDIRNSDSLRHHVLTIPLQAALA